MIKPTPIYAPEHSFEIHPVTPFNSLYTINKLFNDSFPHPRIKFLASSGFISNLTIELIFKGLTTINDGKRPNCDS